MQKVKKAAADRNFLSVNDLAEYLALMIDISPSWNQCQTNDQRRKVLEFLTGYQILPRSDEALIRSLAKELGLTVPVGPVSLDERCNWYNATQKVAIQAIIDRHDARFSSNPVGEYVQ